MNKKFVYHPKKGILEKGEFRYSPIINKRVQITRDLFGRETPLDGTEIPLQDHLQKLSSEEQWNAEEQSIKQEETSKIEQETQQEEQKYQEEVKREETIIEKTKEISKTSEEINAKTKDYTELLKEVSQSIKDITLKNEFDVVIERIDGLKNSIDQQKDYTEALKDLKDVISKIKLSVDLSAIESKLNTLIQKEFPKFPDFPEIPKFTLPEVVPVSDNRLADIFDSLLTKEGRMKVAVDRIGGGGMLGGGGLTSSESAKLLTLATEDKQSLKVKYLIQAKSVTATHSYYFFEDKDLNWYIMRKTLATDVYSYAKGTGGYSSVYVDATSAPSGSPTFASAGNTFD